jgi:ubiquinone/menaquinone biosynthesis C-methylase UbiE
MGGPPADVWSAVGELDAATQERLADVLETRGADPRQQAMRAAFLVTVPFPSGAQVLDVGCGTGVLTRQLARHPQVATVVGVDPAPGLLATARNLAADFGNVTFTEADGRALPITPASIDVVVFDSTLSHVLESDRALGEALRVLRPGGWVAIFDGDYATTTVALDEHDPLQACVDAMMASSVTDRRIVRRLPTLVRACGFREVRSESYGYVEAGAGSYMLTIIDRGADLLLGRGQLSPETAAALKAEARHRVARGTFFGHIAYGSVVARKPGELDATPGQGPATGPQ